MFAGKGLEAVGRCAAVLAVFRAVRGVVKLLLDHAGHALTDDVLLVVAEQAP